MQKFFLNFKNFRLFAFSFIRHGDTVKLNSTTFLSAPGPQTHQGGASKGPCSWGNGHHHYRERTGHSQPGGRGRQRGKSPLPSVRLLLLHLLHLLLLLLLLPLQPSVQLLHQLLHLLLPPTAPSPTPSLFSAPRLLLSVLLLRLPLLTFS